MKSAKKYTICFFIGLSMLMICSMGFAKDPTKEVTIINGQSNPVIVSGDVTVVNRIERVSTIQDLDCDALQGCGTTLLISIPAGKRLVIEQFSCLADLQKDEAIQCRLNSTINRGTGTFGATCASIMTPVAINDGVSGAGQQVSCYSDSMPEVFVNKFGFSGTRTVHVNFAIFGYLEDAQ